MARCDDQKQIGKLPTQVQEDLGDNPLLSGVGAASQQNGRVGVKAGAAENTLKVSMSRR